jgi:hypothetical protein
LSDYKLMFEYWYLFIGVYLFLVNCILCIAFSLPLGSFPDIYYLKLGFAAAVKVVHFQVVDDVNSIADR